jgi:hypothetical protein
MLHRGSKMNFVTGMQKEKRKKHWDRRRRLYIKKGDRIFVGASAQIELSLSLSSLEMDIGSYYK